MSFRRVNIEFNILKIEAVSESTSARSDALISPTRWQRGEYIVTGIPYFLQFCIHFPSSKKDHSSHRKCVLVNKHTGLSPYVTTKYYLAVVAEGPCRGCHGLLLVVLLVS